MILARDHPLAPRLAPQKAPPKAFDLWPRWSHSRPEIPGKYIKPVVSSEDITYVWECKGTIRILTESIYIYIRILKELRASGPVRKNI